MLVASWLHQNAALLLDGLTQGMLLYIAAAGLTVIFGILDVLNLAHGGFFAIGAYLTYEFAGKGGNFAVAAGAVAVAGVLLAGLLEAGLRPLKQRGYLAQALLTLGGSFVITAAIGQIWGYDYHSVAPPAILAHSFSLLGRAFPVYYIAVIGLGIVVGLLLAGLFRWTLLGARLRAAVDDAEMASAVGVNVSRIRFSALLLGTLLAGFGGLAAAPVLGANPGLGDQILVMALVVVVIGGIGSIFGAFVGSIVIGEIQVVVSSVLPTVASFVIFGTMAAVILLRPAGLFGVRAIVR